MSAASPTRTRTFRLAAETLDLLDARAAEGGESANRLASRLLHEALRTDANPLIGFRSGAGGARRAALIGHRISVGDVIRTVRAMEGDVAKTAAWYEIDEEKVRACVAYYADFTAEIDAGLHADAELTRRERERLDRQHAALA